MHELDPSALDMPPLAITDGLPAANQMPQVDITRPPEEDVPAAVKPASPITAPADRGHEPAVTHDAPGNGVRSLPAAWVRLALPQTLRGNKPDTQPIASESGTEQPAPSEAPGQELAKSDRAADAAVAKPEPDRTSTVQAGAVSVRAAMRPSRDIGRQTTVDVPKRPGDDTAHDAPKAPAPLTVAKNPTSPVAPPEQQPDHIQPPVAKPEVESPRADEPAKTPEPVPSPRQESKPDTPANDAPEESAEPAPADTGDQPPPIDPPTDQAGALEPEGEPPLLPSTPADVMWEAWHNGEVVVIDSPEPTGDVLKIYRRPATASIPTELTTPSGTKAFTNAWDIIMVYPKTDGRVASEPAVMLQGNLDLPPDFRTAPIRDPDLLQQISALQEYAEHLSEEPVVMPIGQLMAGSLMFQFATDMTHGLRGYGTRPICFKSGKPHEVIAYHPMIPGARIGVVSPTGVLIYGNPYDPVEVAIEGPDGGYEITRRLRLATLAKEEGYILL